MYAVYQDLSRCYVWSVQKAIVNLPIRFEGSYCCFADSNSQDQIMSAPTKETDNQPTLQVKKLQPEIKIDL